MKYIIIDQPKYKYELTVDIDVESIILSFKEAETAMLGFGRAIGSVHDFAYKMARFNPALMPEMRESTKAPMWKGNYFKRNRR